MLVGKHRIAYIDGLRAVAVLSVVASHAFPLITIGQSFGVDLFFVISGFCLAFPTLAKLEERGVAAFEVYRYAAHRVVRIVPPYYASIALMLLAATWALPGVNRVSPLDVIRQMLFLDNGTTFLTGSFWSLAVEFRWYFVFPLALLLWVRAPRAFLLVVILAAIASQATMATSSDLVALPAFLLGIVAAQLRLAAHPLTRFALPACAAMFALAFLKTGTLISPFWEFSVFLLVVAAGSASWLGRALSMKWLTYIGLTSYSIYLIQGPVIGYLSGTHAPAAGGAAAAVAAGVLFWFFAERPFLNGPARATLLREFAGAFSNYGAFLKIPGSVSLSAHPGAPSPVAPSGERPQARELQTS